MTVLVEDPVEVGKSNVEAGTVLDSETKSKGVAVVEPPKIVPLGVVMS